MVNRLPYLDIFTLLRSKTHSLSLMADGNVVAHYRHSLVGSTFNSRLLEIKALGK